MNTIQKKLLSYILLICIIPILTLGWFYYGLFIKNTKDKLNQASWTMLEQIDNGIYGKISKMKNVIDLMFTNARVHELLRNTDFNKPSTTTFLASKELDSLFSQFVNKEDELESIVLFSTKGGAYIYNGFLTDVNPIRFTMKYGKVDSAPGKITWLGMSENPNLLKPNSQAIVAGTILRDTNYIKDQKYLSTIYFILENDYFESLCKSEEEYASIMIYDPKGNCIYTDGKGVTDNIWNMSLDSGNKVYGTDRGNFKIKIDNRDYMLIFYTSPNTGWKFIRTIRYQDYFSKLNFMGYITISVVIIILIIANLVNYYVVKKITSPIQELVGAMKEVGKENFDVSVNIHSNDELGMISRGFNTMVIQIKELFRQVVLEEQKRKEADILALRYQINPHFLYNTLGAIRLKAISKQQNDLGDMVMILGRFLRNTISHTDQMIKISDEIKNIKDYILLYQIRYDNQLHANFEVEPRTEQYEIPCMLIQPMVENAIMHGLNNKFDRDELAQIELHVYHQGDAVCISVQDNGVGMSLEKIENLFMYEDNSNHLHIGIKNIHKRIKLLYGEAYGIQVHSQLGMFTKVTITLPVVEDTKNE